MAKKRTKLKPSLIKQNRSYTVYETSQLLGACRNTVRQWIKQGLSTIGGQRPFLIHGGELKTFLQNRKQARKQKCAWDEFYCLKCHAPRHVAEKLADIIPNSEKSIRLSGLCEVCEASINKIYSIADLPKILKSFEISKRQLGRLAACSYPNLNCYLEGDVTP